MAAPEPTITKDTLYDFLKNNLEMPQADLDLLHTDKYAFLERMADAYTKHIPFQNLTHTSVPLAERVPTTAEEAVEDVFSGLGGMCWTLNSVFYLLIKGLGFDVHCINGAMGILPLQEGGHLMLLLKNVVKEGDKYLVDVGYYFDSHQMIPFDFDEESPEYKLRSKTVKWLKRDDTYIRCELCIPGQKHQWPIREGDWEHVMFFTLKPRTLDDTTKIIKKIVVHEKVLFNRLRTIRLLNPTLDQAAVLKNETMLIENKHGSVIETIVLENEEAVSAAVGKYFPAVTSDVVRASYRLWHLCDKHVKG